jgi:hypothetical protein
MGVIWILLSVSVLNHNEIATIKMGVASIYVEGVLGHVGL